jgi:hypothetical protein
MTPNLGLWLLPFGMLVMRLGFFPRVLGPLVMFGGAAHAIYAPWVLLAPATAPTFFKFVVAPSGAGELSMLLWLLIKGADARRTTEPPPKAIATS